ncbi:epoxide hydrolase, soluble (sEH) [Scheffersomyces stipitis CBS 6054]|uniref:Epoxide hydrolase, soluble (SEH) n=1 Tax=Scheffersomyces stipitis (strain ATCC 58785 / CBS 6054 / NBRC 10063 / NRRL Y-11545) TaxID=322104 RepID=A3GEU9_PICST|nr:epoxide hydrolase, soluble (sEH) [Scheffersomyces stipitis CBS 6054]EAZ63232.2 epoxide hydrolase, soluble (sEH) [Scheffersomyces stipitis CBS 6054]
MTERFVIKLTHGSRSFTTFSNYSEQDVFKGAGTKWTRVIFLLHGFPDENSSYDEAWPHLAQGFPNEKGLLLLAPLLRGYEESSLGPDEYSTHDVAGDVGAWIKQINPSNKVPVHILGHDWGAITAFKTASRFPELVTSIVTLAIPYLTNVVPWKLAWNVPEQLYYSSYMVTMQLSFLYRSRFEQTGRDSYLDSLWKYWSPTWKYTEKDISKTRARLSDHRIMDATTAYYRAIFNPINLINGKSKWPVDFSQVPTYFIGGAQDGCMTSKLYEWERELLKDEPNVKTTILPNSGHFLHREEPQKVAELAIEFFEKYSSKATSS